jgi:cation diffusion facilitator CzcD-associated flavoprotein CzcO
MAIRLKHERIEDFVLIERGDDVGGSWWANSYPGCQCDIPSNLDSFSFARNPGWDRAYPMRDQMPGVPARLRGALWSAATHAATLRTARGHWVADEQHWELETANGPLAARVLVAAPGCSVSRRALPCPASSASRATRSIPLSGTTRTT